MCSQKSSKDTPNVTFSLESVDGPLHYAPQDGRMIVPCGLDRHPVNRSALRGREKDLTMKDTFGQNSPDLLPGAALSLSLANKLREKTEKLGSTLYKLTWKTGATPAGRLLPRLAASVRRTSGNDCTGWPTPHSNSGTGPGTEGRAGGMNIQTAASLAAWPTHIDPDGSRRIRLDTVPRVAAQVLQADTGQNATGSPAGTTNPGQLNPAHSRWLMGYPPAWDDCGVTAMQSLSPRRKRL